MIITLTDSVFIKTEEKQKEVATVCFMGNVKSLKNRKKANVNQCVKTTS